MPELISKCPTHWLARLLQAAGVGGLLAVVWLCATNSASLATARDKDGPVVTAAVKPVTRTAHAQPQGPPAVFVNRLRILTTTQPKRINPPVASTIDDTPTTAPSVESIESIETIPPPTGLSQPSGLFSGLGDIGTDIAPPDVELPTNFAAIRWADAPARYAESATSIPGFDYTLDRSLAGSCHRPLLFADHRVERYGYHCGCFQPLISAGRFYSTVSAVPYLVTAQDRCQCVPPGGSFCAHNPWRSVTGGPFSADAAVVEAVVITGLFFLIP